MVMVIDMDMDMDVVVVVVVVIRVRVIGREGFMCPVLAIFQLMPHIIKLLLIGLGLAFGV